MSFGAPREYFAIAASWGSMNLTSVPPGRARGIIRCSQPSGSVGSKASSNELPLRPHDAHPGPIIASSGKHRLRRESYGFVRHERGQIRRHVHDARSEIHHD